MPPASRQDLRHGDVVCIRSERWRVDRLLAHGEVVVVEAAGLGAGNRGQCARFLLPFEPYQPVDRQSAPRLVSRPRWRRAARQAIGGAAPAWQSLRAAARAEMTLLPFQLEPALALAGGRACRFLLADAVGLGKTVEAALMIAETLSRRPDARALVVAPAGLRDQWAAELRRRFGLEAEVFDGPALARAAAGLPHDVNPWAVPAIVITSIDYVKQPEVLKPLESLVWDMVVVDEAHHVAGRSDRATAAALLADRARAVVLLTATPHTGDPDAFERLARLGRADGDEPLVVFRRTRAHAGLHTPRRVSLLRVRPTPAEASMHAALLDYGLRIWSETRARPSSGARLAFAVLARRACSSAWSLARSVERRLAALADDAATADGAASTAWQPGLPLPGDSDDEPAVVLGPPGMRSRADERALLERLLAHAREAALRESKMRAMVRLLGRLREPAVVFTEYRDTLAHLARTIDGVSTLQLHGGLTSPERADTLRRFARGDAPVLLATDAGSEGLNLHQRCRLVVNLELPWTPLRLEQRVGRVDRIGQARRVHALSLVAAGTREETTLARLAERSRRASDVLDAITPGLDEVGVAGLVLGQDETATIGARAPLPGGVVTLDLRAQAQEEARRIGLARALTAGQDAAPAERPVMTSVRRRRAAAWCLWVYRVGIVTAGGTLLWAPLLPLSAAVRRTPAYTRSRARMTLDAIPPALREALAQAALATLCGMQQSMADPLRRWRDREAALVTALRTRHARLSSLVMQRGLFDRRTDREAADQRALVDAAISQSTIRLRELADAGEPRVERCELVFALRVE